MSTPHQDLFTTTRWTVVLEASDEDRDAAREALEELCRIYWLPLYAYARGRGYGREDAEDLTQGFLAHILGRRHLARADATRARFRCFLLASFKNYMANEYHRNNADRRGGQYTRMAMEWENGRTCLQIPDPSACSPENTYDREWAVALLGRVLLLLQHEWTSRERSVAFDVLQPFLMPERHQQGNTQGLRPSAQETLSRTAQGRDRPYVALARNGEGGIGKPEERLPAFMTTRCAFIRGPFIQGEATYRYLG